MGITDLKPPLMNYKNGMGKQRKGILKTATDPIRNTLKFSGVGNKQDQANH